ncbi:MAG TPA: SMC-Scp complex subunit ScpB [Candidatus Thermoplasmatota archaeon]|nr:SMC-Scp complex subunit ScpB [Candidatus Thermoplasmatota archaeon]
MTELNPVRIVEAALFSAGKPLLVEEIAQATRLDTDAVKAALKDLEKEYEGRETALEVGRAGHKWSMQIRTMYADRARHLANMEIPPKVLRTLALIAFHQPVKQSDLKDMVGSVVYDHVHELHERGMITVRQDGITKLLATTERFLEYFGVGAADREGIREFLAKKVGVTLAPKPAPAQTPAADPANPPPAPEAPLVEVPAATVSQPL